MFKSIQFYRISPEWNQDLPAVEAAIDKARFTPCGATQERSIGWAEPRSEKNSALVESVGNQWILKVVSEAKLLPGSVVKEFLDEKLEQIEASTGHKPGKKQTRELKEQVRLELLPKSFTKKSSSFVWIDPKSRLLVIDASSKSKMDEIVTLLCKSLDGFGAHLIQTQTSPAGSMAAWLNTQEMPYRFTADRDCVLKANDDSKASVKYAKHALDIEEIRVHIAQGKAPTQLAMTWNDRISFIMTDMLAVKKIEFLDITFEGREDESGFDADAAISTGELSKMIPDLIEALGGESVFVPEVPTGATVPDVVDGVDPLFEDAKAVAIANDRLSISLIQRHLKIGYNRAARLVERIEASGVTVSAGNSDDAGDIDSGDGISDADSETEFDEVV